ncbi:aminobenzoyl-glutamate utilization protein B [Anaerosphaera aminiphila DSM 21120]|uniref:Aminobenzoyl-glutamate utilization protein B n=1 Tax=Anaerosphaera aminiphila DSM 21120 TaxID=1120995 RepID=A0A1M5UQQ2_9FIRM|nr:amidohydrolase [Anaerosphaera aminiphila]SHH65236.1 aminobenzoyl-glutamate utilization protein B [Anaerosphaera aminiphila DSM 21120]
MNNLVSEIKKLVELNKDKYEELADFLWNNPEIGLLEYKSSDKIKSILSEAGFNIEDKVGGIDTAFFASYGSGKPVVGLSCEYDALPGLSQRSDTYEKCPVEEGAAGHACGHNLLGSGVVGTALVLKDYMDKYNLKGTIKLLGTPSEERDACKTFLGRDGYFDDLDFALTWHPESANRIWGGGSLANTIAVFNFKGKSSHAAAAPHLGRSALDAVELMNVGVNYLREHIIPEARVHYAYLDVGGNAPNVVQPTASIYYFMRSPKIEDSTEIYKRIIDIAKGAALMTQTQVEVDLKAAIADYLPNRTLSKVLYESILEYGVAEFDEEDFEIASNYFKTFDDETRNAGIKNTEKFFGKEKAAEMLNKGLTTEMRPYSGEFEEIEVITSDVGELSHYTPTAQMFMATSAIGTPLHSWQMAAQANTSIAKKGLDATVGALALTAIKAMQDPDTIKKAQEELFSEVGKYKTPLPDEVKLRNPKVEP